MIYTRYCVPFFAVRLESQRIASPPLALSLGQNMAYNVSSIHAVRITDESNYEVQNLDIKI